MPLPHEPDADRLAGLLDHAVTTVDCDAERAVPEESPCQSRSHLGSPACQQRASERHAAGVLLHQRRCDSQCAVHDSTEGIELLLNLRRGGGPHASSSAAATPPDADIVPRACESCVCVLPVCVCVRALQVTAVAAG